MAGGPRHGSPLLPLLPLPPGVLVGKAGTVTAVTAASGWWRGLGERTVVLDRYVAGRRAGAGVRSAPPTAFGHAWEPGSPGAREPRVALARAPWVTPACANRASPGSQTRSAAAPALRPLLHGSRGAVASFSQLFHRCQRAVQALPGRARRARSDQEERLLRNVVASLAQALQELSASFRRAQSGYLRRECPPGVMDGIPRHESSSTRTAFCLHPSFWPPVLHFVPSPPSPPLEHVSQLMQRKGPPLPNTHTPCEMMPGPRPRTGCQNSSRAAKTKLTLCQKLEQCEKHSSTLARPVASQMWGWRTGGTRR